ncbi:MAG: hypothetical protein JZU47_06970 [Prolixibacteraceae bacterium]|nr:hypothetical protein [Prolixibacteraceae bacterium]
MSGKLKSSIIQDFESSFVQNCLILWGEAFAFIKANKTVTIDWEEENISALFFDYIDKSERAINLHINIFNEYRLLNDSILSQEQSAKSASRIDFRFTKDWTDQRKRIEYFIEAKNLIENDCFKKGRKTKILADSLHKRYVETGIDNFVSGKYPEKGCLVGYILQGSPENIVPMINSYLMNRFNSGEILLKVQNENPNLDYCFRSIHGNLPIKHYFLVFQS